MNTMDLKKDFHSLIDSIDNEYLLLNFYNIIKSKTMAVDGQLWGRLTKKEQEELLMAFDESENSDNLIEHDLMKNKHQKWLYK